MSREDETVVASEVIRVFIAEHALVENMPGACAADIVCMFKTLPPP
jgi:hypothetical protein